MTRAKALKKKVLIVDDEELFITGLKVLLEQENFEVLTSNNGIDGLLLASHHKLDLVLLDITMSELGGLAMLKKMRSQPWGKHIPILMLTASPSSSTHFQQALKLGTSDYLVKDEWKADQIIEYIKQLLKVDRVAAVTV